MIGGICFLNTEASTQIPGVPAEGQEPAAIDPSRCTDCDSCVETGPRVFKRNEQTGIIEVADLQKYPEDEVEEAIKMCPAECIYWEEK